MKTSLKSLKFTIHPLFIFFVFVLIYQGLFWMLFAYLITITLHELAHFLVANKMGYRLNRFTLMPHGISLSGENVLFSVRDEIYIALAGPVFNLCLAVIGTATWWLFPGSYQYTEPFVVANLVTGLLNFMPIFPMDGGRVMIAVLGKRFSRPRAMKILRVVGLILSILMIVGFVITTFFTVNFTLLVLGIFCFLTVIWEDKTNIYQKTTFLESKVNSLKRGLTVRELAVHEQTTLYKLVALVKPDTLTNFRVLRDDLTLVGIIRENQLERLVQIYPASATLQTILS